jgi:hypothetical protein
MGPRKSKDAFHSQASALRVTIHDGPRDRGMIGKITGKYSDCDVKDGAQNGIKCATEAAQDGVVGGIKNGKMKRFVGYNGRMRIGNGTLHRLKCVSDTLAIGRRRSLRSKSSGGRLDDAAHLLKGEQQRLIETAVSSKPTENVCVEKAPVMRWPYVCSMAWPDADQALSCKGLDRFAHDAAAGAEACLEFVLGR